MVANRRVKAMVANQTNLKPMRAYLARRHLASRTLAHRVAILAVNPMLAAPSVPKHFYRPEHGHGWFA